MVYFLSERGFDMCRSKRFYRNTSGVKSQVLHILNKNFPEKFLTVVFDYTAVFLFVKR